MHKAKRETGGIYGREGGYFRHLPEEHENMSMPEIRTGRAIRSVTDITKVSGYQVWIKGDTLRTLAPLIGAAILEVEFEQNLEQQADG